MTTWGEIMIIKLKDYRVQGQKLKKTELMNQNTREFISKLLRKYDKETKIRRRIMKKNTLNKINLIGIPEYVTKEKRKRIFEEVPEEK